MEPIDLFTLCLINSLIIMGFYAAMQPGNILHFIKKPVLKRLDDLEREKNHKVAEVNKLEAEKGPVCDNAYKIQRDHFISKYDRKIRKIETIYKPIFLCPRCMASVYTIIIFLPYALMNYGWLPAITSLLPAMFITCIMNSIIYNHSDL